MNADSVEAQGGGEMAKPEADSVEGHRHELQPNSRDCFVCGLGNDHGLGMRFYSAGPGQVEARYTVAPSFQGYPGIVHGGIIAAMLDEVVGRVMMTEDPNRFFMTAKLEIRYRSPVPVGEELRLHGQLEKEKGRMSFAHGTLFLADGTLAVEASAAMVDWTREATDQDTLDGLGWQVYDDVPSEHRPPTEVE